MIGILFLVLGGAYVLLCLLLVFMQDQLLFFPESYPADQAWPYSDAEEVWIEVEGARLNGLLFKAGNPIGTMVYFHGNAGNLASWGSVAPGFTQRGYHILVIDYRGYGKSTGKLTESILKQDALAVHDWMANRFEGLPMVVLGRSLGSGPAAWVAANRPVEGLILESPYTSIADEAARRFPIFPVRQLIQYHLPVIDFLQEVACPILIIHGREDRILPPYHSQKIQETHPDKPLQLTWIAEAGHNNLDQFPVYHHALDTFLVKKLPFSEKK